MKLIKLLTYSLYISLNKNLVCLHFLLEQLMSELGTVKTVARDAVSIGHGAAPELARGREIDNATTRLTHHFSHLRR